MSKQPSQEWDNSLIHIRDIVNRNSSENFIRTFINLSHTDKCLVLKSVARRLKTVTTGKSHDDLNERISNLLVKFIDDDNTESFFTDNLSRIKPESPLHKICDDIIGLLCKKSEGKYKLHAFFNQPLPQPIRFVSWYLCLSNANHRQKFVNDLATHPQSVLSSMDSEIQRYCSNLITSLPFAAVMKNSKGNTNAMEIILSYYRSLFLKKRDLIDAEYYYVIPIVLSYNTSLSRSEESCESSISVLIEMYQTFLEKLPLVVRDSHRNNSIQHLEPWFRKTEYYLQNIDQPVYNHLQTILRSSNPYISTTDDSYVLILLRKCCHTWFKYIFVGCFTTDPLLFVWEQYLITSDIPQFHDEFLPAIAAAIIIILKDLLIECKKITEIETILQYNTVTIVTDQLQSFIARVFLPNLKYRTSKSDVLPTVHRTQIDRQIDNQSEQQSQMRISPVHDLLRLIKQTCNRVGHGEGDNRTKLNEQTKNDICKLKFDLKMAEREVIGRILSVDERNALPYEEKKIYSQQKLRVVSMRIENRYAAECKKILDKN